MNLVVVYYQWKSNYVVRYVYTRVERTPTRDKISVG